jgi:hypothetical protein
MGCQPTFPSIRSRTSGNGQSSAKRPFAYGRTPIISLRLESFPRRSNRASKMSDIFAMLFISQVFIQVVARHVRILERN